MVNATARLTPLAYSDLTDWSDDDHGAAFETFLHSARYLADHDLKSRALGFSAADIRRAARSAQALPDPVTARKFFETHFEPVLVESVNGRGGFLTGYYEPVVVASRQPSAAFPVPILRRPPDLVDVTDENRPADWDPALRFARLRADGSLCLYDDRSAIDQGALADQGLELAWLASRVDAFFIHIQGSAKLQFGDGSIMRLAYDGKSGHDYTAIGKVLLDERALQPGNVTMATLRDWLHANPDQVQRVLWQNRSYIFFADTGQQDSDLGPVAAGHVPLTAGRSLAIDRQLMTFHLPIWIEAEMPLSRPGSSDVIRRLMIAQDTGSAIIGPNRADVFVGSGAQAGAIAGNIQHPCRFVVLAPRKF